MKVKTLAWCAGAAVAGALGALAWALQPAIAPVVRPVAAISEKTLRHGQDVVTLGDCMVCHTSKSGAAYAGGLPLVTPFGTIYSTNITPDPETGIGSWSLEAFRRALRQGVSRDGHLLYPAFPYIHYTRMSDADIEAAYDYLMSRTPVHFTAPDNDLLLPLKFRPSLAFWNLLYLHPGAQPEVPWKDPQLERGRYLVDSLGHCASCHSALNPIGGEASPAFSGGIVDGWITPPLTTLSSAASPWNEEQLATYLRTGLSLQHGAAKGPMRPVTERLASAPSEDVEAIAKYIMSIQVKHDETHPSELTTQATAPTAQAGQGAILFAAACASCHSAESPMSVTSKRPDLALSDYVTGDHPNNLIQTMLQGVPWAVPAGDAQSNVYMPPFKDVLTDAQMADVAQYVRTEIGKRPAWPDLEKLVTRSRKELQP